MEGDLPGVCRISFLVARWPLHLLVELSEQPGCASYPSRGGHTASSNRCENAALHRDIGSLDGAGSSRRANVPARHRRRRYLRPDLGGEVNKHVAWPIPPELPLD